MNPRGWGDHGESVVVGGCLPTHAEGMDRWVSKVYEVMSGVIVNRVLIDVDLIRI
jgi:hypothetical protein